MHMQCMALDPFTTVHQTAQSTYVGTDPHSHRILQRLHGCHLICDGTDPANTGREIGDVLQRSPSQHCFEQSRWFVDGKLDIADDVTLDLDQQGAFAFDTCEDGYVNFSFRIFSIIHHQPPSRLVATAERLLGSDEVFGVDLRFATTVGSHRKMLVRRC